jgi:hypothetical protein
MTQTVYIFRIVFFVVRDKKEKKIIIILMITISYDRCKMNYDRLDYNLSSEYDIPCLYLYVGVYTLHTMLLFVTM